MSAPWPSPEQRDPRAAGGPRSPFEKPPVLHGEVVDGPGGPTTGASGPSGPGGFGPGGFGPGRGGVFSVLTGVLGGRDARRVVSAPLRVFTVLVAVPSVAALLLSLAVDSGARVLGFVLGGLGLLCAVLLENRRRRYVGPERAAVGRTTVEPRSASIAGLAGLLLTTALLVALTSGYDLLAALLVLLGVW